jgi:hypothetical protein
MFSRRLAAGLVILGLLVCVAGCGGVNRKNYDKVYSGMTVAQVEKVLGKPSAAGPAPSDPALQGATELMTWRDKKKPEKTVSVGIKDGRVVTKSETGL